MREPPILSLIVFLPLLGALVQMLLPKEEKELARHGAMAFMAVTFLLSLTLLGFDGAAANMLGSLPAGIPADLREVYPTMQFVEHHPWIASLGAHYTVGVDGISLWLVLLTTFLGPLAVLSSYQGSEERVKEYMTCLLLLQCGMLGVLVSLDGLLLYFFWELMVLPLFFLLGMWGGEERVYNSLKVVLYTLLGSALMLLGLLVVYASTGGEGGERTFALASMVKVQLTGSAQLWLFGVFALAFAIKLPLFPLHTWLPDGVETPTASTVLVSGVMLNVGGYGLLRIVMPMFPDAMATMAPVLGVLAVVGIVYGALVAMVQRDLKKLVAYAAVSHLGFCVLGLASMTAEGVAGAIFVMLAHGLSIGGLIFCIGLVEERLGSTELSAMGGMAKQAPRFSMLFALVVFIGAGVPGLAGFVGEFLVIVGTLKSDVLFVGEWPLMWFEGSSGPLPLEGTALMMSAVASLGFVFSAVYLIWMFQRMMFGAAREGSAEMEEVQIRELMYLVPMVLMGVLVGVFPNSFLEKSDASISALLRAPKVHLGVEGKRTEAQKNAHQRGWTVGGKTSTKKEEEAKPKESGSVLGPDGVPRKIILPKALDTKKFDIKKLKRFQKSRERGGE